MWSERIANVIIGATVIAAICGLVYALFTTFGWGGVGGLLWILAFVWAINTI